MRRVQSMLNSLVEAEESHINNARTVLLFINNKKRVIDTTTDTFFTQDSRIIIMQCKSTNCIGH